LYVYTYILYIIDVFMFHRKTLDFNYDLYILLSILIHVVVYLYYYFDVQNHDLACFDFICDQMGFKEFSTISVEL
jgi:hypothetical protein